MHPAIIVSIIAGFSALVSSVVTLVVKRVLDRWGLRRMSLEERVALRGTWEGVVERPRMPTYRVMLRLEPRWRIVAGDGVLGAGTFTIRGGFRDDRYLRIAYESTDPKAIRYGLAILKLSRDKERLEGELLGYASEGQGLIGGTISLRKMPS